MYACRGANDKGAPLRSLLCQIETSDRIGSSRLDAASRFEFLSRFAARVIGVGRDHALAALRLGVER